ncbi:MAG TPA: DNA-directed RNA polymerase subunit alpha [Candidatus Saccharimonadales bacterium]|nr:DNA-directed RNA polymerase subunit alpha [Candidatus Saccharimonadales bacterium]
MSYKLPEISLLQVKEQADKKSNAAVFTIEPLSPGFGLTVGNAIRRVLLSSLEGAAITSIRIDGVSHEFSTIKGVRQDVVDIILNLKKVRLNYDGDESQVIILDAKGSKQVTAGDFKCPTGVEVINKDLVIADLNDGAKMLLEATVERGRGYVSTEQRKEEKLPIGVIALDAAYSPITKVNFETENTRVGKMTNFDKLILELETDGSIKPQEALEQAAAILVDHFSVIAGGTMNVATPEASVESDEEPADVMGSVEIDAAEPVKKAVKKASPKKAK